MKTLKILLCIVIAVPVFILLLWYVAVPTSLIEEKIKEAVKDSAGSSMSLSIAGLSKGIFLSLFADSLQVSIDGKPALNITDFSARYSPHTLPEGRLGFDLKGKIGSGDMQGIIKLPLEGTLDITGADLSAIPYLRQFGMDINGTIAAFITIIHDEVTAVFEVPDLHIDDSASLVPLLNTFRRLQGALSIEGNRVTVESVSLEGDKGYARLKGDIIDNIMNLALELMPAPDKLNTMESMLIGRYIVSPGYYVVPITGPLP